MMTSRNDECHCEDDVPMGVVAVAVLLVGSGGFAVLMSVADALAMGTTLTAAAGPLGF